MKKSFIIIISLMLSIGYSKSKGALLDNQKPLSHNIYDYYENGQVESEVYVYDENEKLFIRYYENGKISVKSHFKNDIPAYIDQWGCWNENGEECSKEDHKYWIFKNITESAIDFMDETLLTLILPIDLEYYFEWDPSLKEPTSPQEHPRAEELMNELIKARPGKEYTNELQGIERQYNDLKKNQSSMERVSLQIANSIAIGLSSSEDEQVVYYTDKNDNVLIVDTEFLGEQGRVEEEFYYHNDSLFFLHSVKGWYNSSIYWGSFDMNKTTYYANQYYFHNGSLVIWLNQDGEEVSRESEEFEEMQKSKWEESQELLTKYHSTDWESIDEHGRTTD